ncbi:uncharacterized protein LOC127865712 [Dreissena polymorpha]|uniref:Uncharacterized protein n=1 Tax=Dreissena polymorpha TaxID=45954 RepID=A0A9D4LMX2_DREPO|nr:uncharacterized protein LOC127865712 [Dreissena polymorpha]KAH3860502.1 hypothetical protein DPMN_023402 [Dreissena polymorpha]
MKLIITFGLVFFALFANVTAGDSKNCFCKVALAGEKRIIQDLGSIDRQTNWLSVPCSRMVNCPNLCDQAVKVWSCNNKDDCNSLSNGKKVIQHYKASVCYEGFGHDEMTCGVNC